MRALAIGFAAAVAAALAAGWFSGGQGDSGDAPASGALPEAAHGGRAIEQAAALFKAARPKPPPPPPAYQPPPPPPPPEPPPPPDVAEQFRRDLAAIAQRGGSLAASVLDPAAPGGRRWAGVGADYRDGWKISRVEPRQVTLQRGAETRTVSIFDRAQDETPGDNGPGLSENGIVGGAVDAERGGAGPVPAAADLRGGDPEETEAVAAQDTQTAPQNGAGAPLRQRLVLPRPNRGGGR